MLADSATKRFNQIVMKQKPNCKASLYNRVKEKCSTKSKCASGDPKIIHTAKYNLKNRNFV